MVITAPLPPLTMGTPVVTVAVVEPAFSVTVAVALAPLEPEAAARATGGLSMKTFRRTTVESHSL